MASCSVMPSAMPAPSARMGEGEGEGEGGRERRQRVGENEREANDDLDDAFLESTQKDSA